MRPPSRNTPRVPLSLREELNGHVVAVLLAAAGACRNDLLVWLQTPQCASGTLTPAWRHMLVERYGLSDAAIAQMLAVGATRALLPHH